MSKYTLGLYWDDLDVQACLLRDGAGDAAVEKLIRRQRAHEGGKPKHPVADDIRAVLDQIGTGHETSITALNEHEVMYRQIKRPFGDRRKIAATVTPEVETLLPIADDIAVDFVIVGLDPAGQTVLETAAVKSAAVQRRLEEMGAAGIAPEVIEAPSSALSCGARNLFDLGPDRHYVVLHVGWRNSSLSLLNGREITHMGALPFGFETMVSEVAREGGKTTAEVMEQALKDGIQAGSHLDRIVREVSIALNRNGTPMDAYTLIPTGYAGYLKDLREHLAAADIAAEIPSLKTLDYNGSTGEILLSFMAVSLAFRGFDALDMVNFRQDRPGLTKHVERIKGVFGFWGKLVLALLIFWVVGFATDLTLKSMEKKKLNARIKQEFSTLMGPNVPMVAPVEQLQQRLQKLQGAGAAASKVSPLNFLREISERITSGTDAQIENFTMDENGLTISGSTGSYDTVERIRGTLSGLTYLSDVKIVSANVNSADQRVLFKITCKAGGA